MTAKRFSWALAVTSLLMGAAGCDARGLKHPEQLRSAYAEALVLEDPATAYALLAPEVQARVPREDFERRWRETAEIRLGWATATEQLTEAQRTPVFGGITVHEGGHILTWTAGEDRYWVVDGLPGSPRTESPSQVIRAFVAALRATDWSPVEAVLSEGLAAGVREDLRSRVEAIEAALDQPDALELSPDALRAELHYDPGKALVLERSPRGWRITAFE